MSERASQPARPALGFLLRAALAVLVSYTLILQIALPAGIARQALSETGVICSHDGTAIAPAPGDGPRHDGSCCAFACWVAHTPLGPPAGAFVLLAMLRAADVRPESAAYLPPPPKYRTLPLGARGPPVG